MKPNVLNRFFLKQLIAAACITSVAYAATAIKAPTGTDLTQAASWSGGSGPGFPTSADVATWDSTSRGAGLTAGSAVNWGSINITGALTNIDITGSQITTGNLTLAGAQTLSIGNAIALSGSSIYDLGNVTGDINADATLSGIISGTGFGITKSGAGTLAFSGANTYTGATTVNGGTLQVNAGNYPKDASGRTTLNAMSAATGATLNILNNGAAGSYGNPNALVIKTLALSGTGTIITGGTGVTDFWDGVAGVNLTSFTGTFHAASGTLSFQIAPARTSGVNAMILDPGAYLDLRTDGGVTLSSLTGTGTVGSSFSAGMTLTVGASNATSQFDGVIQNTVPGFANAPTVGLTKIGTGTQTLTGANTYSGNTTLSAGMLEIGGSGLLGTGGSYGGAISVASGATFRYNSSATQSFTNDLTVNGLLDVASGQVNLAKAGNNQIGSGSSGSILIRDGGILNATTSFAHTLYINMELRNGGILTSSAAAPVDFGNYLVFTSKTITATGAGNQINASKLGIATGQALTLATPAGSDSLSVATQLGYGTSGTAGAVTKAGAGTVTLTGANIYTGATTINGGVLAINGSTAGSAVAVNADGALGGIGTVGGNVAVAAGGGVNLTKDATVGTLTLSGTATFNGTAATPNRVYFDLSSGGTTTDMIAATGAVTASTANSVVVNLNQLAGSAITPGTYTLITSAATSNTSGFVLGTTRGSGNVYSLTTTASGTGNVLQLGVATATTGVGGTFWSGATNATWETATNWNTDATSNSPAGAAPGVGTNVTFATTTPVAANLSTTLGTDYEINSLTLNNSGVTIGGATKMLTLDATSANGNTAGNGITANNATGTNTISAKVGLGQSQTWTVASGGTLAVSGGIADSGNNSGITKAGAGTLTFNGAGVNSYTGTTTLSAGTLGLNTNSLNSTSGYTVNDAGTGSSDTTLKVFGGFTANRLGVGSVSLKDISPITVSNNGSGTTTIDIDSNSAAFCNGLVTINKAVVLKATGAGGVRAGFVTLSGNGAGAGNDSVTYDATGSGNDNNWNTYEGPGVYTLAPNTYSGNVRFTGGATIIQNKAYANGAYVNLMIPDTASVKVDSGSTVNFAWGSEAIDGLNDGVGGGGTVTASAAAMTLTVGASNGNGSFSGVINNGGATGVSLTKTGTGTQTLSGANTHAGTTTVNRGTLNLSNSLALQNSIFSGGVGSLVFDSSVATHAFTMGSLNASTNLALTDNAANAVALTIGNSTTTATYSGGLSGTGGSLTKVGTGTQTLTGANTYTGATTVNAGTLALVGGSQTSPITVNNAGTSLGFTLGAGTTSTSTVTFGAGTTVKITGTPTLASYTLMTASSISGSPTLNTPITGYTLSVTGGNTLVLVQSANYSTWAATNAPSQTAGQDYDNDGVSNGAEYVLGGLATTNDASKLPTASTTTVPGSFVFSFVRKQASKTADTAVSIQVGTTLATWPNVYPVPNTGALGPVVVADIGGGNESVTLTVAQAPDAKKFARLNVVITP